MSGTRQAIANATLGLKLVNGVVKRLLVRSSPFSRVVTRVEHDDRGENAPAGVTSPQNYVLIFVVVGIRERCACVVATRRSDGAHDLHHPSRGDRRAPFPFG